MDVQDISHKLEKVWGVIDCSDSVYCLEALFYIVAILTFFVLIIIFISIYILIFIAKQNSIIKKSSFKSKSNRKFLNNNHHLFHANNYYDVKAKHTFESNYGLDVTKETYTSKAETDTLGYLTPKEWEKHKYRGIDYQLDEAQKVKRFSILNEIPKFSYADPSEILAKCHINKPTIFMSYRSLYNTRNSGGSESGSDKNSVRSLETNILEYKSSPKDTVKSITFSNGFLIAKD